MQVFAAARLPLAQRIALMRAVPEIFRARWLGFMQREAADLRAVLPTLLGAIAAAHPVESAWLVRNLSDVLNGVQAILPEEDFALALPDLASVTGEACRPTP